MWVQEIAGVKSNIILEENIDEINLPLPFVKPFGLTSGASVRGTVGLIYEATTVEVANEGSGSV